MRVLGACMLRDLCSSLWRHGGDPRCYPCYNTGNVQGPALQPDQSYPQDVDFFFFFFFFATVGFYSDPLPRLEPGL